MPSSERTIIRDPVHGPIELTDLERRILDSAPMQRLRHVRQLGLAHLVYPGAHHTRFEHSLGCLHLAQQMAHALSLDQKNERRLRLAALLHDVGHLAFSHDSEIVTQLRWGNHEERGARMVRAGEIADIIGREDSPASVAQWMQGSSYGQLITSDVGADRIDYLLRDAHYTGVAYGVVDGPRILSTLQWKSGAPILRANGLEAAESLIMARFEMFHAVYYHHTVRIIRSMLQQAILEALGDERLDECAAQTDGDGALLNRLRALPASRSWVDALEARRLHKRALMVSWKELDRGARKDAQSGEMAARLSESCGCAVLVSPPDPFKSRTTVVMRMEEGAVPLEEASPLVGSLEEAAESRAQLLVAAPEKSVKKVAQAARKELGI
ncbi:Deoxyguanosinetriphosphate triphosphohydrolase-like protein [uncultured archaeon]|nr:Deoxyguanosinetriphosphate triphosphohydrolase-like protein [uncultured archaeon]